MAIIDHIDGPNRRVHLHADTRNSDVLPADIYAAQRTFRASDETLRRFDLFISASGYESKGGGNFTPRLVKLLDGTRIIPHDSTHTLTVTGEIITDDGQSGLACFDKTLLTPGNNVDINYFPPQVEIIERSSGSGLSTEESDHLLSLDTSGIPGIDSNVTSIKATVEFVSAVEGGRWKIENNQMIFYQADNTTEIARFDLFDANGLPTETDVVERVRT